MEFYKREQKWQARRIECSHVHETNPGRSQLSSLKQCHSFRLEGEKYSPRHA